MIDPMAVVMLEPKKRENNFLIFFHPHTTHDSELFGKDQGEDHHELNHPLFHT